MDVSTAGRAVPTSYPLEFECEALTVDGTTLSVRPIRADDADALNDFHEHLSSDTIYKRFFNAHPHLRAAEIERFTQIDYDNRLALVAHRDGRMVGVGRYDSRPDEADAEVAFVVADEVQGHGVGTLLLEHLAVAARHRGRSSFYADTLVTNDQMQDVFRRAGFPSRTRFADGVVRVTFPIAPNQVYLDSVLARQAASARAWLDIDTQPDEQMWAVCPSAGSAMAIHDAFLKAGTEIRTVVVPDDPSLGVAALLLGNQPAPATVIVDLSGLRLPRRLVTVIRSASRGTVIAVDPRDDWIDVGQQAGIMRVPTPSDAAEAAGAVPPGDRPTGRGALVDVDGCDPLRARDLLDPWLRSQLELDHVTVLELLDSYGIENRPSVRLTAGDTGVGLVVASQAPAVTRLVPLTDVDAYELAGDAAEVAIRLGRLVDDFPQLSCVELSSECGPRAWVGFPRNNADDPFVRRLPAPTVDLLPVRDDHGRDLDVMSQRVTDRPQEQFLRLAQTARADYQ